MNFRQAVAQNARVVAKLSDADLDALLPVLKEARDLTARGMAKWLRKHDGEDKYTMASHRAMLASIDESIRFSRKTLGSATLSDLRTETKDAAEKAIKALRVAAEAGEKRFRGITRPMRIQDARIVMDAEKALMSRHRTSALRYAGRQGDWIRRQLAVGLVRGDSVDAVVSRLVGEPRWKTDKMSDGDAADAIASSDFFRSRADAERLVRTENIHAANAVQMDALEAENEEPTVSVDPETGEETITDGGEGGWQKRWDATFDSRTCEECEGLDGEIVDLDDDFSNGDPHPPAHPYCFLPETRVAAHVEKGMREQAERERTA